MAELAAEVTLPRALEPLDTMLDIMLVAVAAAPVAMADPLGRKKLPMQACWHLA